MKIRFYLTRTSIHQAEIIIEAQTVEKARQALQDMIDREEAAGDFWEKTSDKVEVTTAEHVHQDR